MLPMYPKFFSILSILCTYAVLIHDVAAQERPYGLSERVANTSLLVDLSQGLPIQLWYQGRPLTETQITVFDRAPDGQVRVDRYFSDHSGKAVVPTTPGHSYLLDAVVLHPAPQDSEAVWDTLWASLTFFVAER